MIRKGFTNFVVLSLVAVFALFIVGLPIVQYFCPMGGNDMPCCGSEQSSKQAGVSFTSTQSSCCGKAIIVEGTSTPFLQAEKNVGSIVEPLLLVHTPIVAVAAHTAPECLQREYSLLCRRDNPLFLQHSALLI